MTGVPHVQPVSTVWLTSQSEPLLLPCPQRQKRKLIMDEGTWMILVFGTMFLAFAFFASYMADRQKEREKQERKP